MHANVACSALMQRCFRNHSMTRVSAGASLFQIDGGLDLSSSTAAGLSNWATALMRCFEVVMETVVRTLSGEQLGCRWHMHACACVLWGGAL